MRPYSHSVGLSVLASFLMVGACSPKSAATAEEAPSVVEATEDAASASDTGAAGAAGATGATGATGAVDEETAAPTGGEGTPIQERPSGSHAPAGERLQLQLGGSHPTGFGSSAPRLLETDLRSP